MSAKTDDIQKLKKFLDNLECRIDLFVYGVNPFLLQTKSKDNNKEICLMQDAWKETRPRFKELHKYLSSEKAFKKLEKVGLTASSLAFKLNPVEEAIKRIQKVMKLRQEEKSPGKPRKRTVLSKLRNSWREYFEYADIIIGSMGAVGIPGADAVGEFKSVLEKILKWQNKR